MKSWDCGKYKNPDDQAECEHRDHCRACPVCKGSKWETKTDEKAQMWGAACPECECGRRLRAGWKGEPRPDETWRDAEDGPPSVRANRARERLGKGAE